MSGDRRRELASRLYQRASMLAGSAPTPQDRQESSPRQILTIQAKTYADAREIGNAFRSGKVTVDLRGLEDEEAKRLVDFMAGMVCVARRTIERPEAKVFVLRPPDLDVPPNAVSAERFLYAL